MVSPLISLVIPMHNAEKFITECLDSAVSQTYKNLEIIVVDDASTDKSTQIVKEYTKNYTNIVYVKTKNGNASKTRRDGVEKSTADLICFSDADDVLDKNYVAHLYDTMQKTNTNIAACSIQTFSGEPEIVNTK